MALAINEMFLYISLLLLANALQSLYQHPCVREGNHAVFTAVHDHDALAAYFVRNFTQLLRALVVPAGSNGLRHESSAVEVGRVLALTNFTSRKTVAIRRERLLGVLVVVW